MASPAWLPPIPTPSTSRSPAGSRVTSSWEAVIRPPRARGHVEAEHHAALQVLGDVAGGHPQPGVADVEQEVDHLAGADQHASGRVRLNTRVLAVLVSHKRTTSPALA